MGVGLVGARVPPVESRSWTVRRSATDAAAAAAAAALAKRQDEDAGCRVQVGADADGTDERTDCE